MKALSQYFLLFPSAIVILIGAEKAVVAQDPLAPLVDPNISVPQPLPGGLGSGVAPMFDPSIPNSNLPNSNVPNSNAPIPNVPNPNIQDVPGNQILGNQPFPQNMMPGSFPEAINEPMQDWIDWSEWDSSVELGINGSSGNSESFNISSGFDLKRSNDSNETRVGLKYINNRSNQVLVAHNARLSIDWEKKFGEELGGRFEPSRWSWFIKNAYFYDDFRPFDLRINLNSGLGYKFFEDEIQMLKGRFGVGVSKEIGGVNDGWIPEALFGLDYRRQLSKRQKIELVSDYFPSWEDFSDYRVVSDFNWEYLLDDETNLSLKLNVNSQYDSTPDGAKAHDIFYSLLMLWKF